jgi:hypothetical protein
VKHSSNGHGPHTARHWRDGPRYMAHIRVGHIAHHLVAALACKAADRVQAAPAAADYIDANIDDHCSWLDPVPLDELWVPVASVCNM